MPILDSWTVQAFVAIPTCLLTAGIRRQAEDARILVRQTSSTLHLPIHPQPVRLRRHQHRSAQSRRQCKSCHRERKRSVNARMALYPLSPATSTTVFNQQTSTTVNPCPYTALPTRRSFPPLPPHTPVVIGSLTLARPLPAASTPLVPPTSTKPAPSLACTDSAHCP